jgi:hypothetical protein
MRREPQLPMAETDTLIGNELGRFVAMLALLGVVPFIFEDGKNPILGFRIERINSGQETPYRRNFVLYVFRRA